MSETADPSELNYIERVRHWKNDLPEGYTDDYDTLLSDGVAPRIAAAVIRYVAGQREDVEPQTQKSVADEYDTTPVTIRKHYPTIAPVLREKQKWPIPGAERMQGGSDTPSQSDEQVSTARRVTFYTLYTAERPQLTRKAISNRVDYATSTVYQALRTLVDSGVVGCEYADAKRKVYWAVPRHDTPNFRDENRVGNRHKSKKEMVEAVATERGWESGRHRDGGDYRITHGSLNSGCSVQNSAWTDLLGVESPSLQVATLADEYGLIVGDDIHVNFQVNKSGWARVHAAVCGDSDDPREGEND